MHINPRLAWSTDTNPLSLPITNLAITTNLLSPSPPLTDESAEHKRRHLLHGYRVRGPVALEHLVRQDAGQLVRRGAGFLQLCPRRRLGLPGEKGLRLGDEVGQ